MSGGSVARLLRFAGEDRIVGFLYLGTAAKAYPPLPEPLPGDFVTRL